MTRITVLAPASIAARETWLRMADDAYGDYLTTHIVYTETLATKTSPIEAWYAQVRQVSTDKAGAMEVMRLILEASGIRNHPRHAGDASLDPVSWYEKHLLGGR